MLTPPDPTGRPSAVNPAASAPSSNERPAGEPNPEPPGAIPLPPTSGSTGSHVQNHPLSDLIRKGGSSSQRPSPESDIAQFLAHPQGGAANTDDSPTVITNKPGAAPPPPPPRPLTVTGELPSIAGRKLGHYELIEAIGAGGMAAVLKARDTALGRIVALKILPPEAARDPESVSRFKQEGRAAAMLDHDNVARVYFCGEDQGLHFIAFEFVEGDNLRVLIDRRGPLTAAECVPYMMQVAAGLNHAAERGVVHRDIKPSNILITPDGRAKIVDMGLARYLDSEAVNGGVTQSGVTLGTFDYISPEQALDPRRADVRSDIYSLGCTFYHALTGRPPVPEGTAARKLRAHQNEMPLDPRELNPAVPDELAAILARMMAKDPAVRYQTPTELIAHLKGLAARLNLGADPLANDSATKSVPAELRLLPEPPRVRPWWVAAVAAVALAVVAFVVATSNPGPAPGGPGGPNQAKAPEIIFEKAPPVGPKAPAAGPVTNEDALVARLEDPKANGKVQIHLAAGKFDLSAFDRPIAFKGERLELIGATNGITRVILAASPARDAPGSLSLKVSESLTVRNVWFDTKLAPDVTEEFGPQSQVSGLRLEESVHVSLEDCVFTASDKDLENHLPRSVEVTRKPDGPPIRIDVVRCLFAPAAVGMVVPAGAEVHLTDCGFAPHAVGLQIAAPSDVPPQTDVRLDHCTFMLNSGGCAIETGVPTQVKVTAGDCVFAPVNGETVWGTVSTTSEARARGVVVRVRGEKPNGVSLAALPDRHNAYYRVDPLGTLQKSFAIEDCKTAVPDVDDKGRVELKQQPWSEILPLTTVASETNRWKAFRLKTVGPDADPGVFTKDASLRTVPLGVAFHTASGRRAYPDGWVFDRPKAPAEARQKVWFPKAPVDEPLPTGVYRNLDALLEDVRPGEVILIRHTGDLERNTIELKPQTKPGDEFRVTFRPEDGSQPVFVIKDDAQPDQTLFMLLGGEVTFENIHFRLRPDQPKAGQTVAAVAMFGGKKCTFNNCVFTLAEEEDSKVAAVHLPNIGRAMMMMKPETRHAPEVVFHNCVIRGHGRGVWVGASRPLNLKMTNTLTALNGPVLLAEAGGEAVAGTSKATFAHVTVLAGGPVVEMHGKSPDAKTAGLVKLEVEADRCLFVAVKDAGRPLVELDAVDDWKTVLNWQVKEGNRYANFDKDAVLAVIKPGGDGLPKEWTRNDWIGNVGESPEAEKRFGDITFAAPAPGLKELGAVKPADVVATAVEFSGLTDPKALGVGADLNELKKLPE